MPRHPSTSGARLEADYNCRRCGGPVSEAMCFCPWCGDHRPRHPDGTDFPQRCPRCERGLKLDWNYCPWCFGPGFEVSTSREYSDRRYTPARCSNPSCSRKVLMPFMRYCPWCRRKVRRGWTLDSSGQRCTACKWGIVAEFWSFCPWCGKAVSG